MALQDNIAQLQLELEQCRLKIKQLERENSHLTLVNKRVNEQLNAALDGTGLCLWEQHIPTGNLTIFNQQWGHLLGFTRQELPAHIDSWKNNLHPEDKAWVIEAFEDHVAGKAETYQAVHRMTHKDGSITWVSDRGRVIEYDINGKPLRIMGTHIDVTKEKRYEEELSKLAHRDPLTQLLNRTALIAAFEHSKKTLNKKHHGALCFIDLDGFKVINDHLGHRYGDSVLIHIATNLSHTCQQYLTPLKANQKHYPFHVARFGGDEFVILTQCNNVELLTKMANTLLDLYRPSLELDGETINIGLSIGISLFDELDEFANVCEQADKAMYSVKKHGKHNVLFW
ncbi:sensor domain-containing diguanylate cyclase [Shewanella inventionis]|uniref:Diguanylate cyclase n=1 Tax=Shewanella inventionis TaxID=1738770 RepID=A0ABQ1J0G4_9GAMM|nr:sensor domain-containing diguanylate cyclase [Shewanella inventionis]MCL1158988.1 sensor domain-containing diguanylate cyclase [Shewanella inventionis]UAL45449.1 sensor domain-containing diguanylate cyclase [Shewanella inventionis]GGB56980.1 diguanylate cyclase [Shewanella inventionis]